MKKTMWAALLVVTALATFAFAQSRLPIQSIAPYDSAAVIVPSNTVDLPDTCRAIYVGLVGDITVNMARNGTNVAFLAVPTATELRINATRVYVTGTSATNLVCLY